MLLRNTAALFIFFGTSFTSYAYVETFPRPKLEAEGGAFYVISASGGYATADFFCKEKGFVYASNFTSYDIEANSNCGSGICPILMETGWKLEAGRWRYTNNIPEYFDSITCWRS